MRVSLCLGGLLLLGLLALPASPAADSPTEASKISWKKTVVDRKFRSEGVAVADVNKDGKLDILVGDVWFEAPDWKVHEIRKPAGDYRNGDGTYSECMACWADDINGDGWPDLVVIGFPGKPAYWYENPQGKPGHWKEHIIWHSACNETPLYADLFGTGKRVLIMGAQPGSKEKDGRDKENEGQMCWFRPGPDPTRLWEMHAISEPSLPERTGSATVKFGDGDITFNVKLAAKVVPGTFRFSHGLGVGDVNGDGRLDVLSTGGWWEQPARDDGKAWKFHPANLGDACADMFAYDVDGDGKADIISTSAHNYGMWWHQQKPGKNGEPEFLRRDLFPHLLSQTHALHCVDINGDGVKDLVTGKRWLAHGSHGDADPNDPAVLYWFEGKKGPDGLVAFLPHLIDNDSGIGTQFVVTDFNGDKLPDIIVSNKKGTFVFEQVRSK